MPHPRRKPDPPKRRRAKSHSLIQKTMLLRDLFCMLSDSRDILASYGLSCQNCSPAMGETIGDGCDLHGLTKTEAQDLLNDLRTLERRLPIRPAKLTITPCAAGALARILKKENLRSALLRVTVDQHGDFCLETTKKRTLGDRIFSPSGTPSVKILASPAALRGLGGSTIDFREERFTLDAMPSSCKGDGSCGKCTCGKHESED